MEQFSTILVPLDGSPLAEKAIAPAGEIAMAVGRKAGGSKPVRLILFRAVPPLALMAADPYLYDEMMRMGSDEAQAYLNTTAETLSLAPAVVETRTIIGSPADAIVQFAEDNDVDLIVMSSHGRTGSSRWVYGSVAEKVMHHASCATAIIRAHIDVPMFHNRKLLVPLDGSELAEQALDAALPLADAMGSTMLLLRVVARREPLPQSLAPDGGRTSAALSEADEAERAEAETYLQQIRAAHDNKHVFHDVQVADGDVADAIIDYAENQKVDMIVMSSHGRSGIGRWLHGSVAEKVLRGANCATMIIRDRGKS